MSSVAHWVTVAALASPATAAPAVPHRLEVGERLPDVRFLAPRRRVYLRYELHDANRRAVDIWLREVTLDTTGAQPVLHIVQRWVGAGAQPYTLDQDSSFAPDTLRPIRHERTLVRDGKSTHRGFEFTAQHVTGDPDPRTPEAGPLDVSTTEPVYNFETDIELLEALPLKRGYQVSIPFYDPGREPPARYRFASPANRTSLAWTDGRTRPGSSPATTRTRTGRCRRSGSPRATTRWSGKPSRLRTASRTSRCC
jgi:hypothetical protein